MLLGFLGLGKMGQRIVKKLIADEHEVVVWNRSHDTSLEFEKEIQSEFSEKSIHVVQEIAEFKDLLSSPRIFWLMLPAGEATESVISQLDEYVQKGDIIIDGGNAHYKDTEKRYLHFEGKGVGFLGIGVSGGILAIENGFPLMVGGAPWAYEKIKPILNTLSLPHGGYDYFGSGGAGHFIKMVHNGIEYGMMQSIGEGFGVLEKSQYDFSLEKVANVWSKNTIISGFLMDRTKDALIKDPHLNKITGEINATGEAAWTIEAAKEEEVPVSVIEDSLEFRKKSKTDKSVSESFAAKTVAALRHEFGGHTVKEK